MNFCTGIHLRIRLPVNNAHVATTFLCLNEGHIKFVFLYIRKNFDCFYSEIYHREGVRQLCRYLDLQYEIWGYLLIYDLGKESGQTGKSESIETEGKKIFVTWV